MIASQHNDEINPTLRKDLAAMPVDDLAAAVYLLLELV